MSGADYETFFEYKSDDETPINFTFHSSHYFTPICNVDIIRSNGLMKLLIPYQIVDDLRNILVALDITQESILPKDPKDADVQELSNFVNSMFDKDTQKNGGHSYNHIQSL